MNRNLLLSLSLLTVSCGPAWSQIVPQQSAQPVAKETHAVKATQTTKSTPVASQPVEAAPAVAAEAADKSAGVQADKPGSEQIPAGGNSAVSEDPSDVTPPDIDVPLTFDSERYGSPITLQPSMQKANTIAPAPMAASNTTSVPSALTSGNTVRVQGLTNFEALTNIMANAFIILGIAWGGPSLVSAFMRAGAGEQNGLKVILHVVMSLVGIMAIPGVVNWLVASGREAGVFLSL
jgi:hypothetical protein